MDKTVRECPLCGRKYIGYPAISRRDNKTEICSSCGASEAISDYFAFKEGQNVQQEEV